MYVVNMSLTARATGEPVDEEAIRRQIMEQYEQTKKVTIKTHSLNIKHAYHLCSNLLKYIPGFV